MKIENEEVFRTYIAEVTAREGYRQPLAFGIGVAVVKDEHLLDTVFPYLRYEKDPGMAAVLSDVLGRLNGTGSHVITEAHVQSVLDKLDWCMKISPDHPNVRILIELGQICRQAGIYGSKALVAAFIDPPEFDVGPQAVPDTYLRLCLLSHRLVKPNSTNLKGLFDILPNVAHTSEGPIKIRDFPAMQLKMLAEGKRLHVHSVDKFPPMADYVIPDSIRIADASRVRLGAHLGEGTTVMHEGFVNFNAGTLGKSMVEGRISAGVVIGDGSDIGGGVSILGTLSGGNKEVIAVGKKCLLGANSGLGISLGDNCTVEAGLYLTAGTKVTSIGDDGKATGPAVKASTFSGQSDLRFWRNSQTGQVEVFNKKNTVELNAALHNNA